MDPIAPERRRVVNLANGEFVPLLNESGREDGKVLQVNPRKKLGFGFHIYRMEAGHATTPHEHEGDEEFLVLEGEIVDHDGHRYGKGDLVWLEAGTMHNSYTPEGALLAVYYRGP
ncbi:MAG: cupin domain-containing protein [Albidovulum sp.]|nr:cupin domain-containing protein [Albidovulum sp.]MDE0533216.1 cupin domain-containing protein [Albidovulum sp.]